MIIGLAAVTAILTLPLLPGRAHAQEVCEVNSLSEDLSNAKSLFASSCPGLVRRDCDPAPGGGWRCSSGVIGVNAPAASTSVPLEPGVPLEPDPSGPAPEVVPGPVPVESGAGDGVVCEVSTTASGTLRSAVELYASRCANVPRADCDPIRGGGWTCSSGQIAASPAPGPAPDPMPDSPTPPSSPNGGGGVGRLAADDLLVLHYDNCPDRDDGHAMAAAYTLTQRLGLSPLVVNGTCGASILDRYQPSSSSVVLASFGSALNALTDPARALSRSVEAWVAVLAGDRGRVWIAEGGPSDFTARVLRTLARDYPGLDPKRVRVVQHSNWNEDNTDAASLRHVQQVTGYTRLADGNLANATADLNQLSGTFVAAARSSRFSRAWNAAFDYLNPNQRLDFSDTVELLHIVGDSTTRNPEDFAERYLK